MHEDFDKHMQGPRMASGLSAAIGLLTLALACLGIFGVVSYGVALRRRRSASGSRSGRSSRHCCERSSGRS
jgi:hypothetical protein